MAERAKQAPGTSSVGVRMEGNERRGEEEEEVSGERGVNPEW